MREARKRPDIVVAKAKAGVGSSEELERGEQSPKVVGVSELEGLKSASGVQEAESGKSRSLNLGSRGIGRGRQAIERLPSAQRITELTTLRRSG